MTMRTALRIGLIGALLLVVAGATLYLTQRERLLNRLALTVQTVLSERLGSTVEIGRLRLDLVPLALIAEQVTLRSSSPDLPSPLTIDRVTIRPSLISFLTESQVIRSLAIDHPHLVLVIGPGSTSNLPSFTFDHAPENSRAPSILIRRIDVSDGELAYRSPKGEATLSGIEMTVLPDVLMRRFVIDLSAQSGTITVGDRHVPIGTTAAHAIAERKGIVIERLVTDGQNLRASANGRIVFDPSPALDLSCTVETGLEALATLVAAGSPISGHLTVSAQLKGPVSDPIAVVHADARGLIYDGTPVGDLSGRLTVSRLGIDATDVEGSVLGGHVRGTAHATFEETPSVWSLMVTADHLRPAPMVRHAFPAMSLPPFDLSGPVELHGRGWSLSALSGNGRLTVTKEATTSPNTDHSPSSSWLRPLLELIGSGDIPWTIHEGSLTINDGVVRTATGQMTLSGHAKRDGRLDLRVLLTDQELAPIGDAFQIPIAIAGLGGFDGKIFGSISSPQVTGRATIRDVVLRGHPAGNLEATFDFHDRRLVFHDIAWRKGDSRYDVTGMLDWTGASSPQFDVTARLTKARVGDVLPLVFEPLPLEGIADGTFTFRGSSSDFRIVGELNLMDGSIYGQAFDEGSVGMDFDRTRVAFTHATVRRGESEVRGRGTIDYHGGYEAEFHAPRIHLQTLNLFGLDTLPLSGTVSATMKTAGTFDRPEMHVAATILNVEAAGQPLGRGHAVLDVKERRLHLDATLDDQRAKLDASLAWQPGFPVSAALTMDNSSLVPLLRPWLPPMFADLAAAVTGRITLDGPLAEPLRWRVESRLTALTADIGEFVVQNQGDLVLILDAGQLTIGAFNLKGTDTTLNVSGSVDLFKEYRLVIAGEADLHLVKLVTPAVSSGQGRMYLALKISDRWDSPKIQGGVTVQEARFRIRNLPQTISVDSTVFFFNERQILLESFEGHFGKGQVSATGQIQLKGFRPDRFGYLIDLNGIEYPLAENLIPTFSGQLVFQGTPEAQSLRGELTIDRAIYTARFDVEQQLLELRKRSEALEVETGGAAVVHRVSLNIHFNGKDHIGIKNNLARIPLEVDLFLRGTADRPYLIGRVEAREGQINFRSNEFQVQSATVDFIDPARIHPVIELRADTTIRRSTVTYRVTFQLSGTIERFDLDLTSDPSLNETDILALLAFGRTTEEAGQSSSALTRDEAAALAFQALLQEGVAHVPGVDQFVDCLQIDSYTPPDATTITSSPQLSVCKQLLNERLTVNYSTTLDSSKYQAVRVEYALSRSLFLIGEQDDKGLGGDLRYRFEFR